MRRRTLGLQRARVRAYTLVVDHLRPQEQAHHQLALDPTGERSRAAEEAADRARRRFGHDAVMPATVAVRPTGAAPQSPAPQNV